MPINTNSKLQIISNLQFPPETNNLSKLLFTVPTGVDSFSFHVFYDASQITTSGFINMLLTGPSTNKIPTVGKPFLYSKISVKAGGLSQGYGAVTAPVDAAQAGNVVGNWEAKLDFNSFGGNFDTSKLQVRLCLRTNSSTSPANTYSVPVYFFYVGTKWRGTYSQLSFDFLNNSIYNQPGIRFNLNPLKYVATANVTSNLYSAATSALVSNNAVAGAINVFLVESMQIDVPSAVGFSMLPGPQGFASAYTCVFSTLRDPQGPDGDLVSVVRRIGHEIGHYLGLIHESSCLDTNCTESECTTALEDPTSKPVAGRIRNNLMYTSRPGNHLNDSQVFMLRKAPIITVTPPLHPVTKLRIKVKTGDKIWSWWRGDGGGTDDDVQFVTAGVVQNVNSVWNDFEAGQDWWYTLNINNLNVEDITSFSIGKSFNYNYHSGLLGDDAWLLDGFILEINGVEVFNRQNLGVWLHNDDSGPSSWGASIPAASLAPLLH